MKNFKGNFGVKATSETLLKAFAQTVIELGWTQKPTTCGKGICLFFGSGKDVALAKGEFWQPTTVTAKPKEGIVIYNLPAQWDEAIAAASAEVEEEIKVGDWVVVLPTDDYYDNALQGRAQRVAAVHSKATHMLPYSLEFPGGQNNSYAHVRLATEEEIARESRMVVTIGSSDKEVEVYADGFVRVAGEDIPMKLIEQLIDLLTIEIHGSPWDIRVQRVQVGCTADITMSDLKNIVRVYEALKK